MHALQVVSTPDYTYEDFIEDLRGMVWNSVKDTGKSWTDLAEEASLSIATVSRFAYGQTKIPSSKTVFALERAVGFRNARVRIGAPRQPDEVPAYVFRKHIPSANEIASRKALRSIRRRSWKKKR